MPGRSTLWVAAAVVVMVCVGAVVFAVTPGDDEGKATDCEVVSALLSDWNDTVGAAEQKLISSSDGREGTLALADTEADMAGRIRAAKSGIDSPDIEDGLERWAGGADRVAEGRRDQINGTNRDITAPPPRDYIEGSVAIQEATSRLVTACPSARPADTDS